MLSLSSRAQAPLVVALLVASSGFAASAAPVTVILDFQQPRSSVSVRALGTELRRLLSRADVQVDVMLKDSLPSHAEFHDVVLVKMKGHCSMDVLPVSALSDERGPLAMTYAVEGTVLPFADVDCDRVRTSVQRVCGRAHPKEHESEYSVALARVMAHELYHILARSPDHTRAGISKEALSSAELTQSTFDFSRRALDRFRKAESAASAGPQAR